MQAGSESEGERAGRSLVPRLLGHGLAVLVTLLACLALWIWLDGPHRNAHRLPGIVQPQGLSPLLLMMLLVLACAVVWLDWRTWLGVRAGAVLQLRGVSPLAWIVMPLSVALLATQLVSLKRDFGPIPAKLRASARQGPASMSVNYANHHAGPLVRGLVQRPTAEPPVIWINDLDMRGHTASFYAYPRLMLMEPQQRRWTLQQRMTKLGGPNPLFSLGPRPSQALSRAFADKRGTELLFAGKREDAYERASE